MSNRVSAEAFTRTPWLLLVLTAIVLPIATLLASAVTDINRQIHVARHERQGLVYVDALERLFRDASAYAAVAPGARPAVSRAAVERDVASVSALEVRYGLGREEWRTALAAWRNPAAGAGEYGFVAALADLFPEVADRSGLSYDPEIAGIDMADSMTYRLPKAIASFQNVEAELRGPASATVPIRLAIGEAIGRGRSYLEDAMSDTLEATGIEGASQAALQHEATRAQALESTSLATLATYDGAPSPAGRARSLNDVHAAVLAYYALFDETRPSLDALVSERIRTLEAGRVWREILGFAAVGAALMIVTLGARSVMHAAEVARMRRVTSELHHHATHDALTGLPNRTALTTAIEAQIAATAGSAAPSTPAGENAATSPASFATAVLFIDLDNFKLINDSLGHAAGDRVLCHTAARLQEICAAREELMVARFGGDEFVMLVSRIEAAAMHDYIETVVAEIARALSKPVTIDSVTEQKVVITASVGVAHTEGHAGQKDAAAALLREADAAMYEAKANGRARAALFGPRMREHAATKLRLITDLRDLVGREELRLVYEPLVRLSDASEVASEALVRWRHPTLGEQSPAQFLPTAIETGAIVPIGHWIFNEAIRAFAHGATPGHRLHVNVSARELVEDTFVSIVADALQRHGVDPGALALEVTEGSLVRAGDRAERTLLALRSLGAKIWIDDFGVEYSSLRYLQRLPVDGVKIDRSFVGGADGHLASPAIVRLILDLARSLGLDVMAEGVESEEQRAALLDLGCVNAQGYLFSRAVAHLRTGT